MKTAKVQTLPSLLILVQSNLDAKRPQLLIFTHSEGTMWLRSQVDRVIAKCKVRPLMAVESVDL